MFPRLKSGDQKKSLNQEKEIIVGVLTRSLFKYCSYALLGENL